jgi:hypothetical protein
VKAMESDQSCTRRGGEVVAPENMEKQD